MKNLLKKICAAVMVAVMLFSFAVINVSAENGSCTIAFGPKNPKQGEAVTVTITYNLDREATAVSGALTFDSAYIKFESANNCTATEIDSGVEFNATGNGKKFYIKLDLMVVAEGKSQIRVIDAFASDGENEETVKGATATLTTKNATAQDEDQNINDSTSAALTSITVTGGQLTPSFDKNVTEYKVTVPYSQTDGMLSCESFDQNATITVEGSRQLKVGNNTRVIVVTNNGQTRRYTVVFNRLDQNGNDTTTAATAGVKVTVSGKEYTIGQQDAMLTPPMGFTLSTATYGETEVAAYKNASGKVVLLYLVSSDGSGDFFLYENNTLSEFIYISTANGTYILKDVADTAPEGMYKTAYDLNGKSVSCYKYSDKELVDFIVFSAVAPNGNSGHYSYDENEKTMQRVVKLGAASAGTKPVELKVDKSTKTAILSLISILAVLIIVLIIALVIKAGKKSGRKLRSIFDTEEDEYEMEEDSDDPDEE